MEALVSVVKVNCCSDAILIAQEVERPFLLSIKYLKVWDGSKEIISDIQHVS